jgi:uncharacterized protein (DUF433 family)
LADKFEHHLTTTRNELRREYPELEDENIRQALVYAATYLDDRIVAISL